MPTFFVSCAKPLEPLLKVELDTIAREGKLPASVKETVAGAYVEGTLELAYRICLWSRLANSVFLPISTFAIHSSHDLYQEVRQLPWLSHLLAEGTMWIDVSGKHPAFNHPHFAAQVVKDGIADHCRDKTGQRPSIQEKDPDLFIHLHLENEQATLSLNLSGESLHRRGYRLEGGKAPLKETLAAAILLRAGWPELLQAQSAPTLIDPLCGSGTFLVEGAFMAFDMAPGLHRKHFGFLKWKQHLPRLWEKLMEEAKSRAKLGREKRSACRFFGSDTHPMAIQKSLENIERAGLSEFISINALDCKDLTTPSSNPGLIICNPPYGERMDPQEIEGLSGLYQNLSQALKSHFLGWKFGIFSGAPKTTLQALKLRSQKQYQFFNGALPCQLTVYKIEP